MRPLVLILTGLLCAAVWLALLLATGFSTAIVGIGLAGMLVLMGKSA